jgi:hypothetical protein
MSKTNFLLHHDKLSILEKLSDEDAGKILKEIYHYSLHINNPEKAKKPSGLNGLLDCIVDMFKSQLDSDLEKYNVKASANRENGLKGGRPSKNQALNNNPSKPKANPIEPNKPNGLAGLTGLLGFSNLPEKEKKPKNETEENQVLTDEKNPVKPSKADTVTVTVIKEEKIQKEKKPKKVKGSELEIPLWIDKDIWNEFLKIRKSLKAVHSELALKSIISKLEAFREKGYDANEIIKKSIVSSWKDVFEPVAQRNFVSVPTAFKANPTTEEQVLLETEGTRKNTYTPTQLGVSPDVYRNWLANTRIQVIGTTVTFYTPSKLCCNQLQNCYFSELRFAMKNLGVRTLSFEVEPQAGAANAIQ